MTYARIPLVRVHVEFRCEAMLQTGSCSSTLSDEFTSTIVDACVRVPAKLACARVVCVCVCCVCVCVCGVCVCVCVRACSE